MNNRLAITAALLITVLLPDMNTAAGVMPQRIASLDSLASDIARLGTVPMWGDLSVLAAANSWFGLLCGVQLLPGDSPELITILADTTSEWGLYGMADYTCSGDVVLALAPVPRCFPEGLTPAAGTGSLIEFHLDGFQNLVEPAVAVRTPGMSIIDILPDSIGLCSFTLREEGIYWVEVMENGEYGPSIVLLFPVISGGSPEDVLTGRIRTSWSEAASPGEIFMELNHLRESLGIPPLERSNTLDSVALIRSSELALSGTSVHFSPHNSNLPDILPAGVDTYGENIGRGRGYQEAWSMILISPFHLRTCLSQAFTDVGISGAIDSGRFQWQIVLVQIFISEGNHI